MKPYLIIAATLALAGCAPDPRDIVADVEAFGFTNVTIDGVAFLGCGRDDQWGRRFTATNPAGQRVEGVVCGGWAKGATVRITGRAAW